MEQQLLCGICYQEVTVNEQGTGFEGHTHPKEQIKMAQEEGRFVRDDDPKLVELLGRMPQSRELHQLEMAIREKGKQRSLGGQAESYAAVEEQGEPYRADVKARGRTFDQYVNYQKKAQMERQTGKGVIKIVSRNCRGMVNKLRPVIFFIKN